MLQGASPTSYSPARGRVDVLAGAAGLIQRHAGTAHQCRLLMTALRGLQDPALDDPPLQLACVHLPLLVYASLRGDAAPAIPLAVVTALLHLGIDVFDDLADGDLPAHWAGHRPAEIHLAAATLFAALPQLALADLDAAPACRVAMQRALAGSLLRMSAGQQRDLALAGAATAGPDDIAASVDDKSGEELALFAALAAQLAGAPAALVRTYAALGHALGTGRQFAEDCYDLFTAPHSRDLASGARTLPIALYLERQTGEERARFLALLADARRDAAAQEAVRRCLRAAGVLRHCAVIVEVYCQRARRLLEEAAAGEPGRGGLQGMVDVVSFFPRRPPAVREEATKEVALMV